MPGPVAAAIGAGLGSAAIGAVGASKAAKAQKDASKDSLRLQADMFNRQDELAEAAANKTNRQAGINYDRTTGLAGREKNALTALAREERALGGKLASYAFNRNSGILNRARTDVLGDISRDRGLTTAALGQSRDAQLAGFNTAERANLDTLEGVRDRSLDYYSPAYETGTNALTAYAAELGLGKGPAGWQGLSMTPGAKFILNEGRTEIEGGAAGAGGLFSGATLEALEKKRAGIAATDRDNQMGQLLGLVGVGQNATGAMAGIEQNYGSGVSAVRSEGARARGGVWADYGDDSTANTRYWNGAEADATGRYAGALAGLTDQDYARRSGINADYFNTLGGAENTYTNRVTDASNRHATDFYNLMNNRVSFGNSAAQNYAANGSNALTARGQAGATGAINTANSVTGGISNGLGVYGMLGGTFGSPFGADPNALGNTQWPMSKPPMARPF